MVVTHIGIYRDHHVTHAQLGRRIVNGAEYLRVTSSPGRTDTDEEEFDNTSGSVVTSIGGSGGGAESFRAGSSGHPSTMATEVASLARPSHPPPSNRIGLRRPPPSRAMDFNDYTSRHRIAVRASIASRLDTNDGLTRVLLPTRDGPFASGPSARHSFPLSQANTPLRASLGLETET
jgi:hypothetical protein